MTDSSQPQPQPQVELRALTPDDWRGWRALRLTALADSPYAFGARLAEWQDAPEERWRDRLAMPGSHNVVAHLRGEPVGMASGVPADRTGTANLISMWVAPVVRGLGVGDALVEEVARWAVARGARSLALDVVEANVAARTLYERHGFTVLGTAPRESPDEPVELRMVRTLAVTP